jgi:GT2 family glycosyltransferase
LNPSFPEARIVILNYKGETLLPQCLPSIVEAARSSRFSVKVTVLDNLGENSGLDYVRQNFPEVEIYLAKENKVLCSYNDYAKDAKEPILIFLNNDIRVDTKFTDPLIEKFVEDPECFLAAPRVMSFDGNQVEAGRARSGIRFGFFWCDARYPGYEKEVLTPSETDSSGFGAFSREKFLSLQGYDDRFFPGIMEDVDLCYRAKKAGFHLYYAPQSIVYHMGQASFKKKFGQSVISEIAHRNNFLFMWKTFHGFSFWLCHLFFLPLRLLFAALKGNWGMVRGFWKALEKSR